MRKTMPVREAMSRLPTEVDRCDPLGLVVEQMRAQHCHHVPVMDGAHLFGVLSRQDLHEIMLREARPENEMTAGDVCTRDVLTVVPTATIFEVAQKMLERQVSSALVTDGDVLVGIFTSNDAVRLIAEL